MVESSPHVIVIAGPNGAGKSTLAPFLLRDMLGLLEFVNADTIARGLSAFSPEDVAFEAGRIMLKRMDELADRRVSFAFETTLAGRSHAVRIDRYRRQHGYKIHLLFLWLRSVELAVQRVRARVRVGGHDIPLETIRRRYKSGALNFFSHYQALADTWGVYDNSVYLDPLLVATGGRDAPTTIFAEDVWQRFNEQAR